VALAECEFIIERKFLSCTLCMCLFCMILFEDVYPVYRIVCFCVALYECICTLFFEVYIFSVFMKMIVCVS